MYRILILPLENKLELVKLSIFHLSSAQVLTKTSPPEIPKETIRPLPSSASSNSSRASDGGSESGSPASLSTKQLVHIAADIQKLQEQVSRLGTQSSDFHLTFLPHRCRVLLMVGASSSSLLRSLSCQK